MMKSMKKIKMVLLGGFYGCVFLAQMIGWTIINHIGAYGKSIWNITGTAILMTVITCSLYLLLRTMYLRTHESEEITLEDIFVRNLEPNDKIKTCLEILLDAEMNVRGYLEKPLDPKELLKEVLLWYKITERQLFSFRYIKVKRVYMFLLYETCLLEYAEIAEMTNCKNELEVIRGIEKIEAAMRKDIDLLADVGGIVDRMKAFSEMYPE